MDKLAVINPQKFNYDMKRIMSFASMIENEVGAEAAASLSKEDIGRIIRRNSQCDMVIAIGGDGTVYEVVNCIDLERQALAVIPRGTGNGFALNLDIKSTDEAIWRIKRNRIKCLDLIEIEYQRRGKREKRYCVSTSGVGYVKRVVQLGERMFKPLKKLCYPASSIITAFFGNHVRVIMDNARFTDYTNIIVNNTIYAGNFKLFDYAKMDDGLMEIVIADNKPLVQIWQNISKLTRAFDFNPGREFQDKEIALDFAEDVDLMIDGEIIKNVNNIRWRIADKKLRCVI